MWVKWKVATELLFKNLKIKIKNRRLRNIKHIKLMSK